MPSRKADLIELAVWFLGWVVVVVLLATYANWEANRLRRPFAVQSPQIIWLESQGSDVCPDQGMERN